MTLWIYASGTLTTRPDEHKDASPFDLFVGVRCPTSGLCPWQDTNPSRDFGSFNLFLIGKEFFLINTLNYTSQIFINLNFLFFKNKK